MGSARRAGFALPSYATTGDTTHSQCGCRRRRRPFHDAAK